MSEVPAILAWADLTDADRPAWRDGVLGWVLAAGQPYFDWLFGGADAAREAVSLWMDRDSSEVALQQATLVQVGGEVVGGFIALSGAQLRAARLADTAALAGPRFRERRRELLGRLKQAGALFHQPDADAWYLSKMGVLPTHRGRGHGRHVLAAYLAAGRAGGHAVFNLDVAATNLPARRLYAGHGFAVIDEQQVAGTPLHYLAMRWPAGGD